MYRWPCMYLHLSVTTWQKIFISIYLWQLQYMCILKLLTKECQSLTMPDQEMSHTALHTFKIRWSGLSSQLQKTLTVTRNEILSLPEVIVRNHLSINRPKNDFTQNVFVCIIVDDKNKIYILPSSDKDVCYVPCVCCGSIIITGSLEMLWNPNYWARDEFWIQFSSLPPFQREKCSILWQQWQHQMIRISFELGYVSVHEEKFNWSSHRVNVYVFETPGNIW